MTSGTGESYRERQTAPQWIARSGCQELVSVIIPAWNRRAVIMQTLDSVRDQRYRPIEMVIVDDGSTDDTLAISHQYAKDHGSDELSFRILTQDRRGSNVARNKGISCSRGEFIQFLDSDDIMHAQRIERAVAVMSESPEVDMVVCRIRKFHKDHELVGDLKRDPVRQEVTLNPDRQPRFASMRWDVWQATCRRSLIADAGPLDQIELGGTYAYVVRLKLHSKRCSYLPYILAYYRQGSPHSLVRFRLEDRVSSQMQETRVIVNDLDRFGVTASSEWREISRFAFGTYRKAIASGKTELRREAYSTLRLPVGRWNRTVAVMLRAPEWLAGTFIALLMAARQVIRRFGY